MQKRRTLDTVVGFLVILALLVILAYVAIRTFSFGTPSAIVTAAITLGSALVIQTATSALQRRREMESDQRKEKARVYQNFMNLWFDDMLLPILLKENKTRQDGRMSDSLIRKMGSFTKEVILWGSDDVLREYSNYRRVAMKQEGGSLKPIDPTLVGLERLFLAFRRDLGYRNKGLAERDLLALFINDLHEPELPTSSASSIDKETSLRPLPDGDSSELGVRNGQQ